MTRISCTILLLLATLHINAQSDRQIILETKNTSLVYSVGGDQRLHQSYIGRRLADKADYQKFTGGREAYLTSGMENQFEPAIRIVHADGNPSLELRYASQKTERIDD